MCFKGTNLFGHINARWANKCSFCSDCVFLLHSGLSTDSLSCCPGQIPTHPDLLLTIFLIRLLSRIFYCFGLIFSRRKFSFKYKFFDMSETAEIAENQRKKKQRKLSHDELLRLLSVFEGELQARLVTKMIYSRYLQHLLKVSLIEAICKFE